MVKGPDSGRCVCIQSHRDLLVGVGSKGGESMFDVLKLHVIAERRMT